MMQTTRPLTILAIETSCDETGVAVLQKKGGFPLALQFYDSTELSTELVGISEGAAI